MTEPLLPTAVRLAHAAEALAALAAHIRVETEGSTPIPSCVTSCATSPSS